MCFLKHSTASREKASVLFSASLKTLLNIPLSTNPASCSFLCVFVLNVYVLTFVSDTWLRFTYSTSLKLSFKSAICFSQSSLASSSESLSCSLYLGSHFLLSCLHVIATLQHFFSSFFFFFFFFLFFYLLWHTCLLRLASFSLLWSVQHATRMIRK